MAVSTYPRTVTLKDGREVALRPLASGDTDRLHAFFMGLPEKDRIFLRHDVCNRELVHRWVEEPDLVRIAPIVALDGDHVVGNGTLHLATHGWSQHVGLARLVTAVTHRNIGLGGLIARELVSLAEDRGLEMLQAHIIEDDTGTIRLFEALGFERVAVIQGVAKDLHGKKRNLLIMLNDVSNLDRIIEDWIQDTMIPAFRAPGAGEA